jgi:hypothetical protein
MCMCLNSLLLYDWCGVISCKSFLYIVRDWESNLGLRVKVNLFPLCGPSVVVVD